MLDVLIIGAGVSGCAAARELSRCKADILVLDKEEDVCCGTSKANSAIVHAGYDAVHGSLMAKLNVEGSRRMPALAKELDFAYDQCGSLVVCLSEQDRPGLEKLYENGVANGVEGLRIIERDELAKMEPNVSDDAVAALWAPTGGIVCPFGLTYAFAENAAKNGVKFQFDTTVTGVAPIEGGWRVETNKGSIETRLVVNAAGVHADELHNAVDTAHPMQIIARRGDYFLLDHAAAGHVHHTIFQLPGKYGKGVLVTPTVHGNLLVGPNAQPVAGDDTACTADGLAFVAATARRSVPGIRFGESIRNFAGVRANVDTGDFVIGEADGAPGFIDLAGMKSPGLSSAPAVAKEVTKILAAHNDLPEPKTDYKDGRTRVRFKELPPEQKAELIAKNPAYGRVICRCETITEGEILDALQSEIPAVSIDGVKRRCNAGMGRCQGGFCGPRVLELISKTRGIDPLDVLQDKAGTNVLLCETKTGRWCNHG